ncbi:MAG: FAD-dependent oxidoreductase [Clostridiaceae bacterium]|nr:FAD-dependent oxidoreductase [Clostridiaceae bacterium]
MKTDVLVIGGSATGLVAAMTAKSHYPDKSVTVVRRDEKVMVPCGIPYIFGTVKTSDNNVLPDEGLRKLGVTIVIDEVLSVDKANKQCTLKNTDAITYDKLILGVGSQPVVPGWLPGTGLKKVFTIQKSKTYLDQLQQELEGCQKIAVIGAGFIGVEVSDELVKIGKDVTLFEILPHVLGQTFDDEFAVEAEKILASRQVKVVTGIGVSALLGDDAVRQLQLSDGTLIDVDAVILSMGYKASTELAQAMGLEINAFGFIKADQYRRTSAPDIFAAGDCAEKVDFATGKLSRVMLASTACTEGRIAGLNLYGLDTYSTFKGTVGIYFTFIGDTGFGVAGLTEKQAQSEGFNVVTGTFSGIDRHPGKISDVHAQTVKLIVSYKSGVILGGAAIGGKSLGELVNVIGVAIQNHMTVHDLMMTQIGTHPLLTASPAGYPLIKAAEIVANKLRG